MRNISLIVCLLSVFVAWGQVDKKTQLEQQKKDNLAKIKELNSIISRTSKKKNASIGKLNVLKEQIVVQKKQINVLNENQQLLAAEASKLTHESDVLAAKLERLKKNYALMLYEAQKVSTVSNKISFLLLSNDLGEFTRRFDYLRHFTSNRKEQAHKIFETRQDLMTKKQQVVFKKNEEKKVLLEKEKEKATLEVLKTKETKVVTVLTQQEKKLRTELERKKLAIRKLDNLIAGIVQREIQKSMERERKLRMAAQARKLEVNKPALPKPKLEDGMVKKYEKPTGDESKEEAKLEARAEKKEVVKPKKEVATPVAKVEEPVLNSNTYYMNADEARLASSFAALRGARLRSSLAWRSSSVSSSECASSPSSCSSADRRSSSTCSSSFGVGSSLTTTEPSCSSRSFSSSSFTSSVISVPYRILSKDSKLLSIIILMS